MALAGPSVAGRAADGDVRHGVRSGGARLVIMVVSLTIAGLLLGGVAAVHRHNEIVNAEPLTSGSYATSQQRDSTSVLQFLDNGSTHAVTVTAVDADGTEGVTVLLASETSAANDAPVALALPVTVPPGGQVAVVATVNQPGCAALGAAGSGSLFVSLGLTETFRGHSRRHQVPAKLPVYQLAGTGVCR